MSDQDNGDQSGKAGDKGQDPAPRLFGHKGGAAPWEPDKSDTAPASAPASISAPYPRDAQYAPRPFAESGVVASDGPPASPIFSEVDDEAELTKLHPNYKLLMRLTAIGVGFVITIAGLVLDGALLNEGVPLPFGIISGVAALIALVIIIRIPMARYNARGYQISRDRLRVVRGVLWHSDTIVPFGRVQHIDVDQGPIERVLNLATMTLHTAGSHNASVRLPGLGHELATQMREEIRAHIKRESM